MSIDREIEMKKYEIIVDAIRFDGDAGAWIKVIIDLEAGHDSRLSETIELNFHMEGVVSCSIELLNIKARARVRALLEKALSEGQFD